MQAQDLSKYSASQFKDKPASILCFPIALVETQETKFTQQID